MRTVLQHCRRLALVWASIGVLLVALLGAVACGDPPRSFSVFTQQPQEGSGEAITLQSADQIHPLWAYQPAGTITSAGGIVSVSYLSDVSKVGAGDNTGNITPTLSGGTVSVLDAVDALRGRRLWRFQAPELPVFSVRPLVVNDTIYFALSYHVCALHAQNGAVRWCVEVIDRKNDAEYIVDGELAFENGVLFVGAYQTLIAVDAATGKRMWSAQTLMRSSHLVTGDDLVYVSAADGQISAFDASTGQRVWRATQVPDTPFPNSFAPVPFLDGGTLYVFSGRNLVAYQGKRGDVLWHVSLHGGKHGGELYPPGPVFAKVGGTPYVVAFETNVNSLFHSVTTQLVAYNLQTHEQAWSKELEGQSEQALAASSGVVYAASATIDRPYSTPSERHVWLTMMDLRSGQVARQLQNNDSSFWVDQLVGDDRRLFVVGQDVTSRGRSGVFALGR